MPPHAPEPENGSAALPGPSGGHSGDAEAARQLAVRLARPGDGLLRHALAALTGPQLARLRKAVWKA
jgi:hypothetical protein